MSLEALQQVVDELAEADPSTFAATLKGPGYIGRCREFSRPGDGVLLQHGSCRAILDASGCAGA